MSTSNLQRLTNNGNEESTETRTLFEYNERDIFNLQKEGFDDSFVVTRNVYVHMRDGTTHHLALYRTYGIGGNERFNVRGNNSVLGANTPSQLMRVWLEDYRQFSTKRKENK